MGVSYVPREEKMRKQSVFEVQFFEVYQLHDVPLLRYSNMDREMNAFWRLCRKVERRISHVGRFSLTVASFSRQLPRGKWYSRRLWKIGTLMQAFSPIIVFSL